LLLLAVIALDAALGANVRLAHRHEIEQRMDEKEAADLRDRVIELENEGAGGDKYAGFGQPSSIRATTNSRNTWTSLNVRSPLVHSASAIIKN